MTELYNTNHLHTITNTLNEVGLPFVMEHVGGGIECSHLYGQKYYLVISHEVGYGYSLWRMEPEVLDGRVVGEDMVLLHEGIKSITQTAMMAAGYGNALLAQTK